MRKNNITKRLLLGTILGVLFGVLCFAGFASNKNVPVEFIKWQTWSCSNIMMWATIANRAVLGTMVALAGFITINSFVVIFKIPVFLRGIKMGLWVSLPMALGSLMGDNHEAAVNAFWFILGAGAFIGMVIDLIITKVAGQGKDLTSDI